MNTQAPKAGRGALNPRQKGNSMKTYVLIIFYNDGTMTTDFFTNLETAECYLEAAREKNLIAMIYQKMAQYTEQ